MCFGFLSSGPSRNRTDNKSKHITQLFSWNCTNNKSLTYKNNGLKQVAAQLWTHQFICLLLMMIILGLAAANELPLKKKIAWINNEQNYSNSAHHNLPQHGGQWALRWQSWVNILCLNMILGSWVFCLTMLPLSLQNMGKPLSLEETWNPSAALVWMQAREIRFACSSRLLRLMSVKWVDGVLWVPSGGSLV